MSNLNRHSAATGPHQEPSDAMAGIIRAALKPHPVPAEEIEAIKAAREAEATAAADAETAKAKGAEAEEEHAAAVEELKRLKADAAPKLGKAGDELSARVDSLGTALLVAENKLTRAKKALEATFGLVADEGTKCAQQEGAQAKVETAKSERDGLDADHKAASGELEKLISEQPPEDVEKIIDRNRAIKTQSERVEVLAGRLPDARTKVSDAVAALNAAKVARVKLETKAGRDLSQRAMPAPHGQLSDLNAAAMNWALDRALHPADGRNTFPSASLGEFIDNHFHPSSATEMVELARAEISTIIRG